MSEWTDGEVSILIEHGARKTDEELALALPGRSIAAIAKKRQTQGIFKAPAWTESIPAENEAQPVGIHDLATPSDVPFEQSVLMTFLSNADNYSIQTLERTREVLAKLIDQKIKSKIKAGHYSKMVGLLKI